MYFGGLGFYSYRFIPATPSAVDIVCNAPIPHSGALTSILGESAAAIERETVRGPACTRERLDPVAIDPVLTDGEMLARLYTDEEKLVSN